MKCHFWSRVEATVLHLLDQLAGLTSVAAHHARLPRRLRRRFVRRLFDFHGLLAQIFAMCEVYFRFKT